MTARTMRISILRFDDVPYGGTFTGPFFHFYTKTPPTRIYYCRSPSDLDYPKELGLITILASRSKVRNSDYKIFQLILKIVLPS